MGKEKRTAVGVAEAKAHLSELLDRVRDEGAIVSITRHGRPVACLVPVDLVADAGHLADAQGWLEDGDPFFTSLEHIVKRRRRDKPRVPSFE